MTKSDPVCYYLLFIWGLCEKFFFAIKVPSNEPIADTQ
jgi:hypothetical protein